MNHECLTTGSPFSASVSKAVGNDRDYGIAFPLVSIPGEADVGEGFKWLATTSLARTLSRSEDISIIREGHDPFSALAKEFSALDSYGFVRYFIGVADIASNVPQDVDVSVGIGDWSKSVTAYALSMSRGVGLAEVLPGEPLRGMPLLTLGYSPAMYSELLDYCVNKYGRGHVGVVANSDNAGGSDNACSSIAGIVLSRYALGRISSLSYTDNGFSCLAEDELALLLDHRLAIIRLQG